jgi:hypothetical protein
MPITPPWMKYGFQIVWKWVWTSSSVGNLAGSDFFGRFQFSGQLLGTGLSKFWKNKSRTDLSQSQTWNRFYFLIFKILISISDWG